jgi:hypothetical protein
MPDMHTWRITVSRRVGRCRTEEGRRTLQQDLRGGILTSTARRGRAAQPTTLEITMSRRHRFVLVAASITASIATLVPDAAHAQKDVVSCKPVLDAVLKQRATPYHAYMTKAATSAADKPSQLEMIAAGGQNYILIKGRWSRSPMDQAAMVKQEQENIRDAKAYSCRRLRDESVGGVPAVVYTAHSENEDTKSDAQVWVANGTGLVLRNEMDMTMTDGGGTQHESTRYEYTNVQAPSGVK